MSKHKVEEKLNTIREEEALDKGYLDLLSQSNDSEEAADVTTKKVDEAIHKFNNASNETKTKVKANFGIMTEFAKRLRDEDNDYRRVYGA